MTSVVAANAGAMSAMANATDMEERKIFFIEDKERNNKYRHRVKRRGGKSKRLSKKDEDMIQSF